MFFYFVFVENDDNNVFNGEMWYKSANDEGKKDNMKMAYATYRYEE